MIACLRVLALLSAVFLSGCAGTFVTTWKDPNATKLEFQRQKVVAFVPVKDMAQRRAAEDRLAQQIAVRGIQGRTMYQMFPDAAVGNEQEIKAAMEREGVKGVIMMRPVNVDRSYKITEPYQDQNYVSFWGGSYGTGVSMSFSTGSNEPDIDETTVVYVETLVYSLAQNKLVWGGQSKTTNPESVAELIQKIAAAVTTELQKAGLAEK